MTYLLGIDIGTTGVRAILVDETGGVAAGVTIKHPIHTPRPNWSEQDPEDWWKGTLDAVRGVLGKIGPGSGRRVIGLGLSGQMHSSVFLDGRDRVLRRALLWNDGRTTEQCQWITKQVGASGLKRLVGNPALEGFTAPKVIWLRDEEPKTYRRLRTLLLPKDYIRFRLTGEKATEVSDAAGTLLFDVRNRRWSKELLEKLDLSSKILPPVFESTEVCGKVTPGVARSTGLKSGIPVVGGGADNTCGAIGNGIVREGRVLSSIGTSGVIFAHTDRVKIDPSMRVHTFCHSVPSRWYLMGVTLSAGNSLRWFRDSLSPLETQMERISGIDAYSVLTEEARMAPPGSEGLVFLPYLTGERTPHKDASARGVLFGISPRHNRSHVVRAVMEGITFGMNDSLRIIRELGVKVDEVRMTGGGARSAFWGQMQADVFEASVGTVNATEGPAFGAALMAGVGSGIFGDLKEATDQFVKVTGRIEPNPQNVARYREMYSVFRSLYPELKRSFRRVRRIVEKQSRKAEN